MSTHSPLVKQTRPRPQSALLPAITLFVIGLSAAGTTAFATPPQDAASQQANSHSTRQEDRHTKLIGYLPDYDGSYADFAKSIDFSKMTHLYLAFGLPPFCNGTCTASSDMQFSLGQTDEDIRTLVDTAHRKGVKVVLSIGGGGGDQQILQF